MSSVREAIIRAALGYDGHFSVEDLLQVLRRRGVSGAHMATVYRAVPLLVEAKIIQPALLSRGERQLYEAAFEQEHHDAGPLRLPLIVQGGVGRGDEGLHLGVRHLVKGTLAATKAPSRSAKSPCAIRRCPSTATPKLRAKDARLSASAPASE